jgi:hypothetical protein
VAQPEWMLGVNLHSQQSLQEVHIPPELAAADSGRKTITEEPVLSVLLYRLHSYE